MHQFYIFIFCYRYHKLKIFPARGLTTRAPHMPTIIVLITTYRCRCCAGASTDISFHQTQRDLFDYFFKHSTAAIQPIVVIPKRTTRNTCTGPNGGQGRVVEINISTVIKQTMGRARLFCSGPRHIKILPHARFPTQQQTHQRFVGTSTSNVLPKGWTKRSAELHPPPQTQSFHTRT